MAILHFFVHPIAKYLSVKKSRLIFDHEIVIAQLPSGEEKEGVGSGRF
jgi:hypothetical protein